MIYPNICYSNIMPILSLCGWHLANLIQYWRQTWQNQQTECAPTKDSHQPGHLPSLIRVFTVNMKKAWILSYPLSAQRRLWSDSANAQADLSLRWVHTYLSCQGSLHKRKQILTSQMEIILVTYIWFGVIQNMTRIWHNIGHQCSYAHHMRHDWPHSLFML